MAKELEHILKSPETLGSATAKAAHLMIPAEGQRYLWRHLPGEHPYTKFLSCATLTVMQAAALAPTAILMYQTASQYF